MGKLAVYDLALRNCADVQRLIQQCLAVAVTDVVEHHANRTDQGTGICVMTAAMGHQIWRGTMDRFKQGVLIADIGGGSGTQTSLMLGSHIGDNVAIQVGEDDNLNALVKIGIHHLGGHSIHQTLLNLDFRILLSNLADCLDEVAVSQLDDVCLGDDGYIFLTGFPGVLKGCPGNALATLSRLHLEIHGQILVDLNALVAPDVLAFDVLAEEGPVDPFVSTRMPRIW